MLPLARSSQLPVGVDGHSELALPHEPSESVGLQRDAATRIGHGIRSQQVGQCSAQTGLKRQIALHRLRMLAEVRQH